MPLPGVRPPETCERFAAARSGGLFHFHRSSRVVIDNKRAGELVEKWRAEANDLRSLYFDERLASVVSRYADELAEALEQEQGESLTLTAAAKESGYSAEHLGRLLREGKLRNVDRLHAPRVLRRDLPLKS